MADILHAKARKCVKWGAERKKLIAVMKRKAEDLESAPASKKLRVEADSRGSPAEAGSCSVSPRRENVRHTQNGTG